MTHAINWFELPSVDFERAVDFYTTVLNREIDVYDDETEDMDGRGGMFRTDEGEIGGMIVEIDEQTTADGTTIPYAPTDDSGVVVYLPVDDMDDALARVESNGGDVLVPKEPIPDMGGHYAIVRDSEGNRVGLTSGE